MLRVATRGRLRRRLQSSAAICAGLFACHAACAEPEIAAPGDSLSSVWHLGRVTGELGQIVDFYCDVVGLGFRGNRSEPIAFYSVAAINEFTGSPPGAEFRAAFLPIPGTSPTADTAADIYLEALEYRHIDRRLQIPGLADIGVTTLRFILPDLDAALERAAAADIRVVTAGGGAVNVDPPPGYSGAARAVMVRDPDGYPVEIVGIQEEAGRQRDVVARSAAAAAIGAQMTVVVNDLPAALAFLNAMTGSELTVVRRSDWQAAGTVAVLRGIESAEIRSVAVVLPDSPIVLELIEFRGIGQARYAPSFQDIGFGHVAFRTNDIERVTATMQTLGAATLSASGTWTQINDSLRAVYTRDPNGLYIEVIE